MAVLTSKVETIWATLQSHCVKCETSIRLALSKENADPFKAAIADCRNIVFKDVDGAVEKIGCAIKACLDEMVEFAEQNMGQPEENNVCIEQHQLANVSIA